MLPMTKHRFTALTIAAAVALGAPRLRFREARLRRRPHPHVAQAGQPTGKTASHLRAGSGSPGRVVVRSGRRRPPLADIRQRRELWLDLLAQPFEVGRQGELLAQRLRRLVGGEARAKRRQLVRIPPGSRK